VLLIAAALLSLLFFFLGHRLAQRQQQNANFASAE